MSNIIELARSVGLEWQRFEYEGTNQLKDFAELIRMEERKPLSDARVVEMVDATFFPIELYHDYITFARAVREAAP